MANPSRKSALLAAALASILSSRAAHAATNYTWTAGGSDTKWSTAANWTLSSSLSGGALTFSNAGVAPAGTITNTVGSSLIIQSLTYIQNDFGNYQTTTIDRG